MATKEKLMQSENVACLIDHTLLKATASPDDIVELCQQANSHGFFSVCIPSGYVSLAAQQLEGSKVKICTVVGFPLGNTSSAAKNYETKVAVENGANEVDMVINIGLLKAAKLDAVKTDIESVVMASKSALVKVILETCYLTNEEITTACKLSMEVGADFVKTSTGFGSAGATVEHVRLMRQTVGADFGVKASGGIRSLESLTNMVEAGANRIGCSSGVQILHGLEGSDY